MQIASAWKSLLEAAVPTLLLLVVPSLPAAEVAVEICEQGLNDADAWPAQSPTATEHFTVSAFALDRLPAKFVDDGLRGERPSPSLVRMTATVHLPAGAHRVFLRCRSAARIFIDGQLATETPFPPKSGGDGSQKDTQRLVALDLGPGYRFAPNGEFERIAPLHLPKDGPVAVKLEAFVGGREGKAPRRVELGETVAAIALHGGNEWRVLSPDGSGFAYTDDGWAAYRERTHRQIDRLEAITRRSRRASSDALWQERRAAAQRWLAVTPAEPLPTAAATHPIDRFIDAKLASLKAQQPTRNPSDTQSIDFFRDIKPLLDSRCLECHRGEKSKGGLRLDSRESLLAGGKTGPAVVIGDPSRSEIFLRITHGDANEVMPPKGDPLSTAETIQLARWIQQGLPWPDLPLVRREAAPPTDDLSFIRRVTLDTVGVPPSPQETQAFLADATPQKRVKLIDRLLADPRWAEAWMPMWQDLLAENPNILNPTLNNTGPFRWWLLDSLTDDLPVDRMITQLVLQRGDPATGGPAGFGVASQNDAPFAAKGTIITAALLGVDTKCSRCHDSPTGATKQEQLFQLGAMLASAPVDVPVTSSVDPVKLHAGGRKALIEVTLKPGSKVEPAWPFESFVPAALGASVENPRERLALLLTAPENERFAQVLVNRIWARFMGRGIVEPLDDWEKGKATHPELLRWLASEFVRNGYQVKPLTRLILTSNAYQRATDPTLRAPDPLYTAAEPRRLLAEQIVDSMISTTGKPVVVEPVCLDLNGRRDIKNSTHLGTPGRAWMLASLSNERDRPSLSLPRLQAMTDVLSAFGWRGARQDPSSYRDTAPNALQAAILANGVLSRWVTRLSDDHELTQVALTAPSAAALVDHLYLRLLTRQPTAEERQRHVAYLSDGFASRVVPDAPPITKPHVPPKFVTWTNHLQPESNVAKQELAAEAERGDPPTHKLTASWRSRCEDVIWALLNSPEFLYRS
ncbi:MAG: Protein of unknown function DUF1553/DUF1549/Planctomycete cytochrome C [Verrucomicrobia bacterium]|nr:MAG: Protein of unknown function DUF1553/DUF1549/Planctomycete cytochrome C [Verrucomicrobiota bacterium]